IPLLSGAFGNISTSATAQPAASAALRRVRPADPAWPSRQRWQQLNRDVHGRLFEVTSPLSACRQGRDDACNDVLKQLKNPYFISDEPGLTQTLGWLDAWRSEPSAYAVAARTTEDVA